MFRLKLDPVTAWQPFEPDQQQRWNAQRVRHLLRRTGFHAEASQVKSLAQLQPAEAVERLLVQKSDEQFVHDIEQVGKLILSGREPKRLAAWWLYRMTYTSQELLEKLTFFWHGHFATSAAKVNHVGAMQNQYALLRSSALGPFEDLVQAISRDPAMLIYLDSTENRKTHPNENYARELLELFCLGLGNYSEQDIQQIARCFTGWEVKRAEFRFNPYQHDAGDKEFLGAHGPFDGDAAVKIVVAEPAAARFIARKLVRFYVSDELELDDAFLQPLANEIVKHDFSIAHALRTIFSSNLFYSDAAIGRKVRSPVEMAVGFLRATGAAVNFYQLSDQLEQIGQLPFYPPNVKGWDGGRRWINSSTLISRINLIDKLVHSGETKWKDGDLAQWLRRGSDSQDREKQLRWLLEQLIAVELPKETFQKLLKQSAQAKWDRPHEVADLICIISTLPEFHLN
jgi:uncharacterized protein (DUF1800 family)